MSLRATSSPAEHPDFPAVTIRLRCPECATPMGLVPSTSAQVYCTNCRFVLRADSGIWKAVSDSRLARYKQFIQDYERVRAAEGRGSEDTEFYLSLPFRDSTGRNAWQWRVRAESFRTLVREVLPQVGCASSSQILDLGAGNGWLSYRLAELGHYPVAVDLLVNRRDGLAAAAHYYHKLPNLFPRFQAEMDRLPFADGQFDLAIFNASFHYSENYTRTLREALRCLGPGGKVIVMDTPWYSSDQSGRAMIRERRAMFAQKHGTASDSLRSLEYLTDARLLGLEKECGITWREFWPHYGVRWSLRPWIARFRKRREPSQFRIYVAEATQ